MSEQSPFPRAMGTEEEIGMLFGFHGSGEFELLELDGFQNEYFDYVPTVLGIEVFDRGFLSNGFRFYADSVRGSVGKRTNPEMCTPEMTTPGETMLAIEAGRRVLYEATAGYIGVHNDMARPIINEDHRRIRNVRIHHRSLDTQGHTKGIHDNFDIAHLGIDNESQAQLYQIFGAHVLTRSFMFGAGLADESGYQFAQKATMFNKPVGKGLETCSLMNINLVNMENQPLVLELRGADANISRWATHMRLGTAALVVALMGTPLREQTMDIARRIGSLDIHNTNELAQSFNSMDDCDALNEAVQVQRELAHLARNGLFIYADVPDEYVRIAAEWEKYIDDFSTVVAGDAPVELLADRSDWARKIVRIDDNIQRRRARGQQEASRSDFEAKKIDLLYDMTEIVDGSGVVFSQGEKRRNGRHTTAVYTAHEEKRIKELMYSPPQTRAAARVALLERTAHLEQMLPSFVDWGFVHFHHDDLEGPHLDKFTIDLSSDPSSDVVDAKAERRLSEVFEHEARFVVEASGIDPIDKEYSLDED